MTSTAICGTDIHVYDGRIPIPRTGWVMGHEYVGEVVELGQAVTNFKVGDRVVGAALASCGECFYCRRRWPSQCLHQQHFGNGMIPGAQAEFLRVPYGHNSLEKVPEGVPDQTAVLVSDVIPTGYFGAERGEIQSGDVVVVVGSGPVGLAAQMSARLFGGETVIAVDSVPERLEMARGIGSLAANLTDQDPCVTIRDCTEGRGADVVIEAVGHEESLRGCFRYVRPAGTISSVGVHSEADFPFPMFQAYLRDITFRIGSCPMKNYMADLLRLIERRELDPSFMVTHTLPMAEAPRAYEMFANRSDGCVKVVLRP